MGGGGGTNSIFHKFQSLIEIMLNSVTNGCNLIKYDRIKNAKCTFSYHGKKPRKLARKLDEVSRYS